MPQQKWTSSLQDGQVQGHCGQLTKDKFSTEDPSKKNNLCHAKEHGLHPGEALWHCFEHKSLLSDI